MDRTEKDVKCAILLYNYLDCNKNLTKKIQTYLFICNYSYTTRSALSNEVDHDLTH